MSLASAARAGAQDSLENAPLTLRPTPGLELLAAKTARVLALRGNIGVELGPAPPPGLLEAVPEGHVALARASSGTVHLVMGAVRGATFDARVELSVRTSRHGRGRDDEEDVRALALALEALHDRGVRAARALAQAELTQAPVESEEDSPGAELPLTEPPVATLAPLPAPAPEAPAPLQLVAAAPGAPVAARPLSDDGTALAVSDRPDRVLRVHPTFYFSLYGGASPESTMLRTGVGAGGGLCAIGQCLLLAIEYPLPISMEAGGRDVRYRYPTFSVSFQSRPFHWGKFTPAACVALLSRVGYFERDMGLKDSQSGLDTDLGLRGSLEGAYALIDAVDLVAEAGVDYALDRWTAGHGNSVVFRGPRVAPWLQASIRIRPYY